MQTQISLKSIKRKVRSITHTLVKPNNDETDLLIGSTSNTHRDIDHQSTAAHDDSDSTIIYDYQSEVDVLEIKTSSICAMETETNSEEIQSKINSTKNTMETETNLEENQSMTYSTNNKKENINEPHMDSSNNQNMKTVKIILQKTKHAGNKWTIKEQKS